MLTYQDLLQAQAESRLLAFLTTAMQAHESSPEKHIAQIGSDYMRQQNTTITNYRKIIYDINGQAKLDTYSANYQCASNFYKTNITQLVHYLLGNGVNFDKPDTKDKLGGESFDTLLVRIVTNALAEGSSNAYFNNGKIYEFRVREYYAFPDEETGAFRAGIRYWQLAPDKPLRLTLYLEDGYIEFIRRKGEELRLMDGFELDRPKPYIEIVSQSPRDAELNIDAVTIGQNYNGFPIVPCYGNYNKQAEIVGKRQHIDCYDLIESGFANNVDEASYIYWILNNACGMDDVDLAEFKRRMMSLHVAKTNDETSISAHTVDMPTEARETLLNRLERDIYTDAMALNIHDISAGSVTATAIRAASTPLDQRADELETCVIDFIHGLLALIGVEDTPHFRRFRLTNQEEETAMVLSAAQYLDTRTLLEKLPWLTPEEVDTVMDRRADEDIDRYEPVTEEEDNV